MIENIVRRAKKLVDQAHDRRRRARHRRTEDLLDSIKQEFREHEDLPNTTNPDDWAKISGKKGERIVYVRTIVNEGDDGAGWPSDRTRHDRPVPAEAAARPTVHGVVARSSRDATSEYPGTPAESAGPSRPRMRIDAADARR